MNEYEQGLHSVLKMIADAAAPARRSGYFYTTGQEFALKHGVWYQAAPFPAGVRRGAPKSCFGNSLSYAVINGWKYIEGYALAPNLSLPLAHAWNVDSEGCLIDTTWMNRGLAYLGVEFSTGRADDATWNGDMHILDDWKRGWPIFRQPWQGEPPGLVWQPTEAMLFLLAKLKKRRA